MILAITVSAYGDVGKCAVKLNCNVPTGLALLPRNFETAVTKEDLLYEDSVPTVRTLWRQAGIIETRLEKEGERFLYIQENAVDWIGPTVFVSASFLSGNPSAMAVALGIVSNYLTDLFKGVVGEKTVRLSVVKEQMNLEKNEHRYLRVSYEGDVSGLSELADIIREVRSDE